ncbi:hypothetical protein ACE198_22220 [Neobacillus sp. KR4-4]|uniref:hypothetical protein n=1 Tax=Neobacillus sp. KR4-4 TaxID=3344872 RepID=UPI0035C9BC90
MLKGLFGKLFGTSNPELTTQQTSTIEHTNREPSHSRTLERIKQPDSEVRKIWLKVIGSESKSNDITILEKVVLAKEKETNAVDLHFAYMALFRHYYRAKDSTPSQDEKFLLFALKDVDLFPRFKREYLATHDHQVLPSIPSFKQLAIFYEKQGNYQKAIEISEKALSYGLEDKTKGGYAARIEKLKKKM